MSHSTQRSAFLASLPSSGFSNQGRPGGLRVLSRPLSPVPQVGMERAATVTPFGAPAPAWASDIAGSTHGPNYVALARARARAIAARVRDLQGIFTDYRVEIFNGVEPNALPLERAPGSAGRNTLFSALAQSVLEMTEEVENLSGSRAGPASKVYYTQTAKEMEEQFGSLVELLAKQATKLTDDLDAIVLLAQARVARAEATAKEQVRQLLMVQAVSRFRMKVKARCFACWRRGSHRHETRHEWRRQTVRKALLRLSRFAMLSAWAQWVAVTDSCRVQRERRRTQVALATEREQYEAAMATAAAALAAQRESFDNMLAAQRESCVSMRRVQARRQLLNNCVSIWNSWAVKAVRRKSVLFRALERHHGLRMEISFDGWRTHVAETRRRELTRLRTLTRLGTLLQTRAWQNWRVAVNAGKRRWEVAAHEAVIADAQRQLQRHREIAVQHSFTRHARHKRLPAAFDHWCTRASGQRNWSMVQQRVCSVLCDLRVLQVWQQWWGVVEEGRLHLEHADHGAELENERAQAEMAVAEVVATAAGHMQRQWDACVFVWRSKALAKLRSKCFAFWATSYRTGRSLELVRLRVTIRRGTLYQSRAWQQWLAVVDESRAQGERLAFNMVVQQVDTALNNQRNSSARQFVSAAQKMSLASCFASWISWNTTMRRYKLLHFRSLSRKHRIWAGAVFGAWNTWVSGSRQLEHTLLKTVFKLGHLYQARVLQRWMAAVDERKLHAERCGHQAAAAAAAAALTSYRSRTVNQVLIPRSVTRRLRACVFHWLEWSTRRISWVASLAKSLERTQLRRCVRVFDDWCARLDQEKKERLTCLFVFSRIGRLLLLRAWQRWLACVDNTRLELERADYAAALNDVDLTLSLQWESWIKQYLRGRVQNQIRACFASWLSWTAKQSQRTATIWRVKAKVSTIKFATIVARWRFAIAEQHRAREQDELASLRAQLSEQKAITDEMDRQQQALREEIASVQQAHGEISRTSDAIVRREKLAAAAQARAEEEREALEAAVEAAVAKVQAELTCSQTELQRTEKELEIARR